MRGEGPGLVDGVPAGRGWGWRGLDRGAVVNARWLPIGAVVKVPGEPDLRVTATVVDGVTITERRVEDRPLGFPGTAILDVEKARSATEQIAEDPDAYHRAVVEEVEASVRWEQALEALRGRIAALSSVIRPRR